MKTKDIGLIVIVGIISALIAVLSSSFLFTSDKNRQMKAEIVEPISAEFKVPAPGNGYFNENSVNPTQNITIGDSTNQTPFNSKQQ